MSLQDRLDRIAAASAEKIPAEMRQVIAQSFDQLRRSGALRRVLKSSDSDYTRRPEPNHLRQHLSRRTSA